MLTALRSRSRNTRGSSFVRAVGTPYQGEHGIASAFRVVLVLSEIVPLLEWNPWQQSKARRTAQDGVPSCPFGSSSAPL